MMNRLAAFLVVGLALAVSSNAALAATECNTGPPPNPPLSGTIVGGVVVNAGDFCILGGANVSGGVQVNERRDTDCMRLDDQRRDRRERSRRI